MAGAAILPAKQCAARKARAAWENSETARPGRLGRRTDAFIRRTSQTREGDRNMKKRYSPKVRRCCVGVGAFDFDCNAPSLDAAEFSVDGVVEVEVEVEVFGPRTALNDVFLSVTHAQNSPTHRPEANPQVKWLMLHTPTPHAAAAGIPRATTPVAKGWPEDGVVVLLRLMKACSG